MTLKAIFCLTQDADVVQFLSKVFFAYEDDGVVSVSVVRIGVLTQSVGTKEMMGTTYTSD